LFLNGRLGYNLINGDKDYGYGLEFSGGGLYSGLGLGVLIHNIYYINAFYSNNNAERSITFPGVYREVKYSKLSISIGLSLSFTKK